MKINTIRNNRFIISCEYDQRQIVKNLGARWDGGQKRWWIGANILNYQNLIIQGFEFATDIKEVMDQKLELEMSFNEFGFQEKTTSYKHQKSLTNLVLDKKQCFFLCGMGTGKTKAVLDAISELHYQKRILTCLVVSPASIMQNFADEVEKHSYLESTVIKGALKQREELIDSNTPIHIINYEILTKLESQLKNKFYDMIIFDECHRLKNRQSKCSKAAHKIAKEVAYRVGLTGTMLSNSYEDAFMPYKVISPSIFGEVFARFKDQFLVYGGYQNYQIIGYNNKEQFAKLLSSNSLKYDLDDVVDLPEEVEVIKKFPLRPENKKMYDTLKKDFLIVSEKEETMTSNVLERLLRLSQISSGFFMQEKVNIDVGEEKLEVLKETLEGIEGKVIVWCRFTHSIHRVQQLCKSLGLSYMTYNGETKDKGIYKQFNEDDTQVWISQIQTGLGYSIPSAKYAIFYETDYSMVNHVQCKGRNRRLTGSDKGSCVYIYLQAEGTVDPIIFNTLKKKDFNAADALRHIKGS